MVWYDSDFVGFILRVFDGGLVLSCLVICSYWLDLRLLVGSWCWCCVWCFSCSCLLVVCMLVCLRDCVSLAVCLVLWVVW